MTFYMHYPHARYSKAVHMLAAFDHMLCCCKISKLLLASGCNGSSRQGLKHEALGFNGAWCAACRWEAHQAEGYKWWAHRMARALQLYDETRIDHFR
jgi:hypothetical protein